MPDIIGCGERGDGNPTGGCGAGNDKANSLKKSFKKLVNVSDGSDEDMEFGLGEEEKECEAFTCMGDGTPQTLNKEDALTPLYQLNPGQLATISILKAGLDQISWEPLIGLLEDLAATGTVSRFKLHDCATTVIRRILGSDLETQVLQQFHSEPSKGEVIMIESLIFSYVQELSTKKQLQSQNREPKLSSSSVNEKFNKRKPYSKEKKGYQPSYQKTTESFRRKQRCKRASSPQRNTHKRNVRRENKASDKTSLQLNQGGSNSHIISKNNPSNDSQKITDDVFDNNEELNSISDQFYNNFSWSETSVVNNKLQSTFPGDAAQEHNTYRKENKMKRKGKRKIEGSDWDLVETETAIKAYEANTIKTKTSVVTEKISDSVNNPIYSIEFTPSNSSRPDFGGKISDNTMEIRTRDTLIMNTSHNLTYEYCNRTSDLIQTNNRSINSNTTVKKDTDWLEEFDEEKDSAPEKDVNDQKCDHLIKDFSNLSSTDSGNALGSDGCLKPIPLTSKLKGNKENCSLDLKKPNFFGNIFDQSSNHLNIIKVNAEKECSSYCNKTTITEFNEIHKTRDQFVKSLPDCTSVIRKNPSCDNLIALRISEELMNILKEQFIMKKRYDDLSLDYNHDSEEHLPYSEFLKIRTDNSKIMKRLNLISTLTLLVLMSSVLSSTIFLFSSDNNYVQRTTVDFFSRLFCGWCR